MARLSVKLPNGKVFLVFRQPEKPNTSDHRCRSRRYTEETLCKLYLIGEIADVHTGADGLGEKFVFVSRDVASFTGTRMEGFLQMFKRRYHLSHVKPIGALLFSDDNPWLTNAL